MQHQRILQPLPSGVVVTMLVNQESTATVDQDVRIHALPPICYKKLNLLLDTIFRIVSKL
jgi:hypothetical protein